ncbi:MAG TPA: methyltransferase [Roseococcus sp.]|jgi:release factor glutamine methyltransferase|nr:methyltransferase [Roseococcus sp.]
MEGISFADRQLASAEAGCADPWRPSEFTAFLLHTLQTRARRHVRGTVLELGVGSGVVLASLGALGAERLVGTDIDAGALDSARRLLAETGHQAELRLGDLWAGLEGQRFDLIVANPPQFAATVPRFPTRARSWSDGGPDGRRVLDPLLMGLGPHLAEGGRALLVHSAFLGIGQTRRLLAAQGLACRRIASTLMVVPPGKRALMNPAVAAATSARLLQQVGEHCFVQADILDIAHRVGAGR